MTETVIYAALTIGVFVWSFARGDCGARWLGGITFLSWVYYMDVIANFEPALEQVMLAAGDVVCGLAMLMVCRACKMPRWAFTGLVVAFASMQAAHIIHLALNAVVIPYHTVLNAAYLLQLFVVAVTVARDEIMAHHNHGIFGNRVFVGRGGDR